MKWGNKLSLRLKHKNTLLISVPVLAYTDDNCFNKDGSCGSNERKRKRPALISFSSHGTSSSNSSTSLAKRPFACQITLGAVGETSNSDICTRNSRTSERRKSS